MNVYIKYTRIYWDKLLGLKWSCSWPGCHVSKRNIGNFPVLVNVPRDQKHSISSQLISKHQANSGLCAYLLVLSYPKWGSLCSLSPILSIFFCFFCILYLIIVSCLPPIFHFYRTLRMETACFMKCEIMFVYISLKLSSLIIFNIDKYKILNFPFSQL